MLKNFLRIKRKQKGLTLAQLADKAKIPTPVLSMIERGYVEPDDRVKFLIARGLNTKVKKIFPKTPIATKLG